MKHIDINKIRRAMALVAVMIVTMASAMAQTAVNYIDKDGIEQTCETYIEVGTTITAWNAGWYLVNGEVVISGGVTVTGEVHLILGDGARLTVTGAAGKAGVNVSGAANSLTVYGQAEGTGKLTATGMGYANGTGGGAGIGGDDMQSGGNITVNGGIVTANGAGGGAGIGGGCDGTAYNIEINRGTVTANGSLLSTGIGMGATTGETKPNFLATLTINDGDNTIAKAIGLGWSITDVVYVYDGSKLCGTLNCRNYNGNTATFTGDISADEGTTLKFHRYGSGVTVNENGSAIVDFSAQDGTTATLRNNSLLIGSAEYKADGKYNDTLEAPFALARLDLSGFGGNITATGIASTGFNISIGGEITNNETTTVALTNGEGDFHMAFIPTEGDVTYNFADNNVEGFFMHKFVAGEVFPSNGSAFKIVTLPMNCFHFTAKQANTTVAMNMTGNCDVNLEYSINGTAWTEYDFASPQTITLENIGDKVFFRAKGVNTTFSKDDNNYVKFVTIGNLKVSGNIMYLLNGTTPATTLDATNHKYCFYKLFDGCTAVTDASGLPLPATTLAQNCYNCMFQGCAGLTVAPALPATELANECYSSMFYGCTGLTAAPALKATVLTEKCYQLMFQGCTKLSSVTMLATDVSANQCLLDWLQNAGTEAATRTVHVALGMKTTIQNTIPSNWTIEELKPKFSVSATKTVEFAKGNLYWDGNQFHLETNQWDYRTWAGKNSCIGGIVSETGTPSNHCGLFKWSDAANAVTGNNNYSSNLFCKSNFAVDGQKDWRTLTNDEWKYLIGLDGSGRANAASLCKRVTLTVSGGVTVYGLVILPDGDAPSTAIPGTIDESFLTSKGAVFLPAAGDRGNGTYIYNVNKRGYYWSGNNKGSDKAYRLHFDSDNGIYTIDTERKLGCAVRLVR